MNPNELKVGIAQISPVWLDKKGTIQKIVDMISEVGAVGVGLISFGESLLSGYPFWIELTFDILTLVANLN